MKFVSRLLEPFQDSPTYGRDRATLISGGTIGLTSLLLNGVMMMVCMPVMFGSNPSSYNNSSGTLEFGQILALILLGGATGMATFLIPLRLTSVFIAPRLGRYFDQIVLSGITPMRYLIGKVTSQNLFLALILVLLSPWFVLVVSLGGLRWTVILGILFLLWLYCMMLALVMLWLSTYINEGLAFVVLMAIAIFCCSMGSAPLPIQPFVMTPFPAILQPIYEFWSSGNDQAFQNFSDVFVMCAIGMSTISLVSLIAIAIGPLYGIIRDNSTFGEVVRSGDSKKRTKLRIRMHIQRPSEIAFFYENRGNTFRKYEGLIRWGSVLLCLIGLMSFGWYLHFEYNKQQFRSSNSSWWINEYHAMGLMIHTLGMIMAVYLFSHSRNTTFLKLPLISGWKTEVAKLDTWAFVAFLLISSGASIAVPEWFERNVANKTLISVNNNPTLDSSEANVKKPASIFESDVSRNGRLVDYRRLSREGTLVISIAAIAVYLFQRGVCLTNWIKTSAAMIVGICYGFVVTIFPIAIGSILREQYAGGPIHPLLYGVAPHIMLISPVATVLSLVGNLDRDFPYGISTLPFYVSHLLLILACLKFIRRRGRVLRSEYLTTDGQVTP